MGKSTIKWQFSIAMLVYHIPLIIPLHSNPKGLSIDYPLNYQRVNHELSIDYSITYSSIVG
jgi:hypothetical protein